MGGLLFSILFSRAASFRHEIIKQMNKQMSAENNILFSIVSFFCGFKIQVFIFFLLHGPACSNKLILFL